MNSRDERPTRRQDLEPERERFCTEVISGLRKSPKELPPKYLYDEHGSYLYERICALDEYYIPRTEAAIMNAHIKEMVELIGQNVLLIEYGCGSCTKTRILLDHMRNPAAYVPIDISREQLLHVAEVLDQNYPGLEILPVCADYTRDFELPVPGQPGYRTVVYFPGSSIGNFDQPSAIDFLQHIADVCRPDGALLIGVDLKKDIDMLHRAYNDREGVTAAFNLNLLERINRELNGDFQLERFQHHAFYNREEGRIEMHLVSLRDQTVHLGNVSIHFTEGESIWTESSYKYSLTEFEKMAATAGFRVAKVWTDGQQWFSVQYLVGN
jgi:dimethylhistidine N-methyltransferase